MKHFELTGPYRAYSYPWGKPLMPRKEWFVSHDGGARRIVRFDSRPNRYIINNTYPIQAFRSLRKAVAWARRSLRPGSRLSRFFCS